MLIRFFCTVDSVAPIFRDLPPALAQEGHQVEIVLSHAQYRGGTTLEEVLAGEKGVRVVRLPSFGLKPQGLIQKALFILSYCVTAMLYSLLGPRADRNAFLTNPPLFAAWGIVLKFLRRQDYFWIMMDLYPELPISLGLMRGDSSLAHLLGWVERLAIRKAAGIIVLGRCMAAKVRELGATPEQIQVIPNWAKTNLIQPIAHDKNSFRLGEEWADRFVVLYAGNIGRPQDFSDLLEVATNLQDHTNLAFVFIGQGASEAEVKKVAKERSLTNFFFYPFLHETYPLGEILSSGDLHFISLRNEVTGLAVPSKSYSTLAAGRPILYQGGSEGEIARILTEEKVGTQVSNGDTASLQHAILSYLESPKRCKQEGQQARKLVLGRFSRNAGTALYITFLTAPLS
jgi:glycosyltransferase involved in cell wall biosynthesis